MAELLYDALMLGRNKEVAKEEYLVATGQKEPAAFRAEKKNIELTDVFGATTVNLRLLLVESGYLEIEVYCPDEFIALSRKVITTEEFEGGYLEYAFDIIPEKLHNGKNSAQIIFRTPSCTDAVSVTVVNKIRTYLKDDYYKKTFSVLTDNYLDLRIGKMFQQEWVQTSERLLEHINGSDARDLFLMLYKANVLIADDRYAEAKALIEFAAKQIPKLNEESWELRAYFMYIRSLYLRNDDVTADTLEKVREIYETHPNWRLLWILFYLDRKYDEDPARKMDSMEEEFVRRGCCSPVIYYEALECLNSRNGLLVSASDFELQTLYFGARRDFLNINISMRLADVILEMSDTQLQRKNVRLAMRILKKAYDDYSSNLILKALCRTLIMADARDTVYHKYFKAAAEEYIEVPGLYNYYVFTADKSFASADMPEEEMTRAQALARADAISGKMEEIPRTVLEYFQRGDVSLMSGRAWFYANIVVNKYRYTDFYRAYQPMIVRFARDMIVSGKNDAMLAVIYRDMFENDQITPDLCQRMFEIIYTKEVSLDNPMISSVLVFHPELTEYQEVYPENGRAAVRIFSADAVILFKEKSGNLYRNINHSMISPLKANEYIDVCMKNAPISRYMLIGDNLPMLRAVKEPVEILKYLFDHMGSGHLRSAYEQQVLREMIMYFSRNTRDEEVYERLLYFMDFDLDGETRARLTEVMIEQKLYDEAYAQISKNGASAIAPQSLAVLGHVLCELHDYREDKVLTQICKVAFKKTEYDPVIFKYMCRNYNDDLDVLLKMHITAKVHEIDDTEIDARILDRAVETGDLRSDCFPVFAEYYEAGDNEQLKKSYICAMAERYLYDDMQNGSRVFPYMERELYKETVFPDSVNAAFLLYMKDRKEPEAKSLKIAEELLRDMVRRGVMLEEFREFSKFSRLPAGLANVYIAQTFDAAPKEEVSGRVTKSALFTGVPMISYEIRNQGNVTKGREAMNEIFRGCYVKYFTLFYGESVIYSINGGDKNIATCQEIGTNGDGSRFSDIDMMLRLKASGNTSDLLGAAEDYYIKSKIIEKLF